jgi:HPr kinase/phosphorylase
MRENILKTTVRHGSLLQLYGLGVLLTGDSGTGKTTCSLTLAKSGHIWIADDLVEITVKNTALWGKAYGSTKNLAAFRNNGEITIETLGDIAYTQNEASVDLWCELRKDMEGQTHAQRRSILGIALPFFCFPSSLEMTDVSFAIENWVKSFALAAGEIS